MKKRPASHVTDSAGKELLQRSLPREWVVREYQPDYGIDFAVEVFDSAADGFVTLGEHFFVQLKSHSEVNWITKQVHARGNVEKSSLVYNRAESSTIRVIAEALETSELQLARSMGPAAPLLLVVADTTHASVHWVCLNDFVDKVLAPESGDDLSSQATHTIHLPESNRIERTNEAVVPLRFLARRAKLFAAFNRFRYQRHEIECALARHESTAGYGAAEPELFYLAGHFLDTVLAYDFWKTTSAWRAVEIAHVDAQVTAQLISGVLSGEPLDSLLGQTIPGVPVLSESRDEMLEVLLTSKVKETFDRLANLGNMFEEICREWYLPTYLGTIGEEPPFGSCSPQGCGRRI